MARKRGDYAGPLALPQVWGSSLASQDGGLHGGGGVKGRRKGCPAEQERSWFSGPLRAQAWECCRESQFPVPRSTRSLWAGPSAVPSDRQQDPRRGWGPGRRAAGDGTGSWRGGGELDAGLQLSPRPPVPKEKWKPSLRPGSVCQENRIRRRMRPPRRMMEGMSVRGPAALGPNLETGVSRSVKPQTPPCVPEATPQEQWILPSGAEPSQRGSSEPKSIGYVNPPPTPGTSTDICFP